MEKHSYSGKTYEDAVKKAIIDLQELEKNLIINKISEKDGVFKKVDIEVIEKREVIKFIKSYLYSLLKDMGFNNISIEINSDDSSLIYIVNSDNDGLLIGKNGKNLQALSLITSQAIKNMLSTSFKFIIDVGEYKLKREKSLEILALNIAKEVQSTKIEAKLDSMNSYERRIIHNVLKNNKYVYTKSEGEEPKRFVIIKPRED